jgi:N-acetylglucosaminyl-diphospho-decaprenol L-rhamnosyltransferase
MRWCPVSEVVAAVSNSPHVVVAIVATNEIKHIADCLKSLQRSLYRNFSVVICENGGHDAFERDIRGVTEAFGSAGILKSGDAVAGRSDGWSFYLGEDDRLVTILRPRGNLGYSGGVNACIAAAGSEWDFIWVLNPDTFPEPDALGALVRRQAEGGYGMVGSRLVFAASGRVQVWGGHTFWPILGRCRSLGVNQPFDATPDLKALEAKLDTIAGASMFVSKEYIETIGVMDNDFFVYNEDIEWSLRRGRFRLGYAHDSVIRHIGGATAGSSGPIAKRSRFSLYLGDRNTIILAKKRLPVLWPLATLFALASVFEYLVRFRSFRAFKIGLSGWWAGLRGETGMPGFMRNPPEPAAKAVPEQAR